MKKRKNNLNYVFLIVICTLVGLLFYFHNFQKANPEKLIKEDEKASSQMLETNKEGEKAPSEMLETDKEGLFPNSYIKAFVSRVVDGDTIIVHYKKSNYRVRLLDIDTPESVKQGVPVQPYAKKAEQFTEKKLLNKEVKLVFEKSLKDKYDRLLAHVFLMNNDYLNALLVRMGYARAEILKPNDSYKEYFFKQQNLAIRDKLGVWSLKADENPFIKNSYDEYVPRYW